VWALFDDAESSTMNAIKKYFDKKFIVYCFGINNIDVKDPKNGFDSKNYFYVRVDLSMINYNLLETLSKYPKPDILFASPPCESWSGADCAGKMFRSINNKGDWHVKNSKYYEEYLKKCHPVKRRYFVQKEASRILGEATVGATIQIIKTFEPKVWVIENPQTSKTWLYQKHHWNFGGYENLACYSAYDPNFSAKPTIFKSNIELTLNSKRVKGNKAHMAKGSYNKRSSVPFELIKDAIEQIAKQLNLWMQK